MPFVDLPPPPPLSAAYVASVSPGTAQGALPEALLAEEAPPGGPASPAAFGPGTIDLRARLGLNGFSAGPIRSAFGAVIGWHQLQLAVDVGVVQLDDVTVALGAEAFYGRPWLAEALTGLLVNLTGTNADWRAIDTGAAARATFHYNGMRSMVPYGVVLFGPSYWKIEGHAQLEGYEVEGSASSGGLRAGLGGGATFGGKSGLVAGAEVRYLAGMRFRKDQRLTYTTPDGETEELFALSGVMRPPRGLSFVFSVGYRF